MNLDHYHLEVSTHHLSFEFISEGPKGKIKKVIQFRRLNTTYSNAEIYNLGFGDYNKESGMIDDQVVTNNKDAEMVISTIAQAVIFFIEQHPNAQVFAQGSTPSRARYYVMGIAKYLKEIPPSFEIWGAMNPNSWELFKKDRSYKALLVRLK